jgi:hypothetical protein
LTRHSSPDEGIFAEKARKQSDTNGTKEVIQGGEMIENRAVSDGTNEIANQSKQLAVRFAPEIVARIELDAAERNASPTEVVRAIVCDHYSGAAEQAALIRGMRDLIEDCFRHTVYEISRTRSSLYNMAEQSESFGLDRPKLKQIQQLSREDAANYLTRLDAEIDRCKLSAKSNGEARE